jgi:nicotinamidase-related amidase
MHPHTNSLRRRLLALGLALLAQHSAARAAESARPPRSALVVVDAQVGVLATVWERERVVGNLRTLVAAARKAGTPVIWVQHASAELPRDSGPWQLAPDFVPRDDEPVLHKVHNSAFAATGLDALLRSRATTRVVLAGAATNWCVRATAFAAVERGYDLTLVADAHSTTPSTLPDGRPIPAETIVAEFNDGIRWLAAPGVRTAVVDTAEVDFGAGR